MMLVLGFLCFSTITVAASSTTVAGDVTFERYEPASAQALSTNALFMGIGIDPQSWDALYWDFNASSVNVVEHSWNAKGYGYYADDFEYSSRTVRFGEAAATMDVVREQSFLVIAGPGGPSDSGNDFEAILPPSPMALTPSPEVAFTTRYDPGGMIADTGALTTSERVEHETYSVSVLNLLATGASGLDGTILIQGNLSLSVFDTNFTIRESGGTEHTFSSGYFRTNQTGNVPIVMEDGAIHDYEIRKYTLEVEGAAFRLSPGDRPFQLNARSAVHHIEGDVRLADANGEFTFGSQAVQVESGSLSLLGASMDLALRPQRTSGSGMTLAGSFDGTVDEVLINGRPVEPSSGAASTFDASPWLAPWAWISLLGIGVSAAGFALIALRARRLDPDRLAEAAERALIHEDYPETVELADRALRRDGKHLGAHVIKGVGLLRLGRPDDAVKHLEDAHEQVDDPEGVLDLVTVIGLLESGRKDEAAEALRKAAESNPGILEDLEGTDVLSRLAGRGRAPLGKSMPDDALGEVGYA